MSIREWVEDPKDSGTLLRRIRLVVLLDSAEKAGLVPLSVLRLHSLAFLSNVLAPVWNMQALDGKILKRRGGPFYPELQHDLDRLVGMGVVVVSNLSHVRDEDQRWRLEGSFRLHREYASGILDCIKQYETERLVGTFLQELAYALSALDDDDLDRITTKDATYSDPVVSVGNVIDFAEWRNVNYSANAARHFERLLPNGSHATPGEMLHLYARHLHTRLIGGH